MNTHPHVLVADDQEAVREVCASVASGLGYRTTTAATGREALRIVDEDMPDILVCDVRLPDIGGVDLMKRLHQARPTLPVLLTTAYGTVAMAVEAMKLGAFDYVTKPFELEEMKLLLQAGVRQSQLERDARGLRLAGRGPFAPGNLIGGSPAMQRIFRMVGKVAQSRYSVLVLGESGTGK
ncbi:MAG: sigma-54-dependent transcriptional regulator, partial [Terriglobales bacterium]